MSQVPDREDVEAALAQPEILQAGMRAVVLIGGTPSAVRWANEAALNLFQARGCAEMTAAILAGVDPGAKRLRQLTRILAPGAPARVETLRFSVSGSSKRLTWRCRRLGDPSDLFIATVEDPELLRNEPMTDPLANAPLDPAESGDQSRLQVETTSPQSVAGIAEFRAALERRFPGARALRFLWRTTADNRLSVLGGSLCDVVGCEPDSLIGQDFCELADHVGLDPDGRLRHALAGRGTWTKIRVLWPVTAVAAAVPVTLGAMPTFDAEHIFDGWRGFGVIDLLAPESRALPPEQVAGACDAETGTLKDPMTLSPSTEGQRADFGANVVALRRLQLVRNEPSEQGGAEAVIGLTTNERIAFREIALALGARLPNDDEGAKKTEGDIIAAAAQGGGVESASSDMLAPSEPETRSPGESGEAAPHDARPDDARLDDARVLEKNNQSPQDDANVATRTASQEASDFLEGSPFGLLVSRGADALWLNRALLAILRYDTIEQLRDSGGLERLLRGQSLESSTRFSFGEISAMDRAAEATAFAIASHAIDWRGEPAQMTLVRRIERDEPGRVKALESELRRRDAEARELHSILDTATDGVAVLDERGRLLSLNRAGEALFGCEQNDVAGQDLTSLLAVESHAAAREYFAQVASNGVASLLNDGREVLGRAHRGGAIPIFMTLGRVNAGGATKFCAVLRDMTAWKKVERELNEARREAERASALKSDFLAKVSHEIRTPLNAILGFAEVIMDERLGSVGNERYRDYLRDIHASGTHVMSLVNDLLDLSKIEAGKMELNFDTVDANKVVAECVSIMQPQANSERVIVRLSTASCLPHIVADERSLRQIVLNLLSNAVKFNEPGGQVIVSTALTDAGHAVIRIRDTGIGMSDSELITALEPFRQVQTSRQTSGTGLGLPLTKALVEANRASFTVKSKKNEGTLVEVAFAPARAMAD